MKKNKMIRNKNKILFRWILSCILILLIPCISIIYNYIYNSHIINKQIHDANKTVLTNIQYAIDNKLDSIMNLNHLLLIDTNIEYLFSSDNEDYFQDHSQNYYSQLINYTYVYGDLDIMLYLPKKDFIITTNTANNTSAIFNTIKFMKKPNISYENWKEMLDTYYLRGDFLISPYYSYKNFGSSSFVYACTSPFVYKEDFKYNLIVSTPTNFITSYLDDNNQSSFFIINQEGHVLNHFGPKLNINTKQSLSSEHTPKMEETLINGTKYIYTYVNSTVSNWTYVVYTPSTYYLSDAILVRNVTIISILVSLCIGFIFIILTQKNNYKPVKKLLTTLSVNPNTETSNEFELMEQYYDSLHRENIKMKKTMGSFSETAKEIYLLSKLKGRDYNLTEHDMISALKAEFTNKKIALVSIYMDTTLLNEEDCLTHMNLLTFTIYNVADEVMKDTFCYHKVSDGLSNLFIFTLDDNSMALWEEYSSQYFKQIYDFFCDNFDVELYITIGNIFDNFEQMNTHYVQLLNTLEYRIMLEEHGVLKISELNHINSSSYKAFMKYTQQIKVAVVQKKLDLALALTKHLFLELTALNIPFIKCQYHIYSLISSLLIEFDTIMNDLDKEQLELHLKLLLACDEKTSLQTEFETMIGFFLGVCTYEKNITDSGLIARIKSYVNENYTNCNMNISSIAQAMDLNPKYMSKLFKEENTEGLLSYINTIRIEHALKLLKNSNDSVDEIAAMVGFSNSRSFRRNFQKVTGATPKDFKKQG